jgi:leucyl aminopeptidase
MIKLQAFHGTLRKSRMDAIALFVFEDQSMHKHYRALFEQFWGVIPPPFLTKAFTGKEDQAFVFYPPSAEPQATILVGLGAQNSLGLERLRRVAAKAVKLASQLQVRSIELHLPSHKHLAGIAPGLPTLSYGEIGMALAEGALLASYRFDKYLTPKQPPPVELQSVALVCDAARHVDQLTSGIRKAEIIARAVYLARDLANAPGNEIYPGSLAQCARAVGRDCKLKVKVFDEKAIRTLNMGGLLGVGQGSAHPPRFIVMEHKPGGRKRPAATVVLVGKGVTFDSGGISIKPSANMAEMKMDMSGAAAVLGTMKAAAALKLPVHLFGLIPAAENLPGGRALKPGDILKHHNGKTSEIDNTDAEGRLILADALSYASRFKPDLVIDLATLTGAVVVALGHYATGMLGNSPKAMDKLRESGARTYERVWELPMFEEYEKLIKSDIADVKNVGGRWAGAITGAFFLKKFIGDYPWVHLDIAGTAILEEAQDYIPRGGSGVGVRLLIDLLSHWSPL